MGAFSQKMKAIQKSLPVASSRAADRWATGSFTALQRLSAARLPPDQGAEALLSKAPGPASASRFAGDFSRIPAHPTNTTQQTNATISQPGDPAEQEAERLAEQVMRRRQPVEATRQNRTEDLLGPNQASTEPPPGSGKALEPLDRHFFEARFGHPFAGVRLHLDREANQSALDLQARAYTAGSDIHFAPGEYKPRTSTGRRLLAHELAHVVQQRNTPSPYTLPIQRQPKESPPKEEPPKEKPAEEKLKKPPAKKKTLKSEGVDLSDPVAVDTATVIDEVLLRNQKLAPYIGDRLTAGFRIAEKGKFVQASSDGNFDNAYRKAYDISSADTVSKDTTGFFDPKKSEIHLRPNAKFGTALHESVHRLASPGMYSIYLQVANKLSSNLTEVLKEGVTAYFVDLILKDEGLPNFNDAYRSKKKKVETLIAALGADGFDLIAKFNFKGSSIVEIGEKLGYTSKQFSDSQGKGIREVLKRMENAM